ncbi:MAG TPA: hypothetical protein VGK60_01315 [Pedococcus sp.]
MTTRLAELDAARSLLGDAVTTLQQGWVQDRWQGREGVCLVGSLQVAGRGRQLTARSLDLVWHALVDDAHDLGWVPSPQVRLARVRDLTRWNDRHGRTVQEVVALIRRAEQLAAAEMVRLRAELGFVAPARA